MYQLILPFLATVLLIVGASLGYYARQSIARRDHRTIEAKIQKKIQSTKEEAEEILALAKTKANKALEITRGEIEAKRDAFLRTEKILLEREKILNEKITGFDGKETEFNQKVEKLKEIKLSLENLQQKAEADLEKISGFSKTEAKKELFIKLEESHQKDILERMKKLEVAGVEAFEKKSRELISLAIQRYSANQAQEISTTTLNLPSEEIKGRIIGKEGRNIRAFEKATGVELVVDDAPESVVISSFDPVRRQIARLALEKLIKDGRIQPARIEEVVAWAEQEINSQMKEAGEQAVYEMGILDLEPKIVQLLGRLRFRTSYGQNVLLHSMEVGYLAEALAAEIGANAKVAKKAGLLHDIGKAVDHQIEGSHLEIGMKILEKFKIDEEIILAMRSHHETYPYANLEALLVHAADAISGARPGARKDTAENYLKRLGELEAIANSFSGVEKSYAIQAGREIRVFVRPEEIYDYAAKKLAREIADRIQDELKYPGEIKVHLIRETKIIEYAR